MDAYLTGISILLSSSGEASTTGNILNALSSYLGREICIVAAGVKYIYQTKLSH